MSLFEYIMILMSIVLGFGITSNLRAISRLKLEDMKLDSFVILGYYLTIIFLQLDYWMVIWDFSERETWSLLDIAVWFLPILVLFLAGAYLDRSESEDIAEVRFTRKAALVSLYFWTIGAFITINTFYEVSGFDSVYLSLIVFMIFLGLGFFESNQRLQVASSVGCFLFGLYFLISVGDSQLIDSALFSASGNENL